MDTRVRPASLGDAEAIARLLPQLTSRERAPGAVAALLAAGDEQVLVAERCGEVTGVAAMHVHQMLHQPLPVARLTVLVVDQPHRRRGAGQALLEAVLERARRAGCSGVELTTSTRRQDARGFYESQGFSATSLKFWRPIEL